MTDANMKSIRFHQHGEPADVLRLEDVSVPSPGPGHVAVRVHACGLNPADWAICRGMSYRGLPCGIGLDVSGVVTAVGHGVDDVAVGDEVFGPANFMDYPTAGASEYAILSHWDALPTGLSHVDAAALPMVIETAARYLDWTGLRAGQTILVNGAGTMVGFAAVQMAIARGARVIATAGKTFADVLRSFGAVVTPHGEGVIERVRALVSETPDIVLDAAPANLRPDFVSALPDLVEIAGGDPNHVITIADAEGAKRTGVRTGAESIAAEGGFKLRWDAIGTYGQMAAEGSFSIPVAQTFALADWREALGVSLAGGAQGKLILLPRG
ncbi:NADPH:quinone reductase-like Zn-dependent oxidoreductase [Sphingopyxis panaciterrae]|uniref:NADP-dependent oxidoreductase n=1 Tax=Sphingopyxis panaciterrae TaxID=363841 RepID=UPI00141F529B|nr:NADP-dependent oxidoreductase [Sphingopyxis panaciterrae]NIJ37696.1 NADPH:quinone reductase-like Zn-dependent oxidoreductase [Sphingopyxis panaciterrae]